MTRIRVDWLAVTEGEIEAELGRTNWIRIGQLLHKIREERLYAPEGAPSGHKEWESYCMRRWGWSRSYCNRLIRGFLDGAKAGGGNGDAAYMALADQTDNSVPIGPAKESHARELRRLDDPEERRIALLDAEANKKGKEPTAAEIKASVAKLKPKETEHEKAERAQSMPPALKPAGLLAPVQMLEVILKKFSRSEISFMIERMQAFVDDGR